MTINLRSDSGTSYYAILVVSLSLNTESDNYEKYSPTVLAEKEDIIKNNIVQIVSQYSKEEIDADPQTVKDEILADMQSMFGADYVVGVNFPQIQTGK
jgi:flagellar FliL protein